MTAPPPSQRPAAPSAGPEQAPQKNRERKASAIDTDTASSGFILDRYRRIRDLLWCEPKTSYVVKIAFPYPRGWSERPPTRNKLQVLEDMTQARVLEVHHCLRNLGYRPRQITGSPASQKIIISAIIKLSSDDHPMDVMDAINKGNEAIDVYLIPTDC